MILDLDVDGDLVVDGDVDLNFVGVKTSTSTIRSTPRSTSTRR